MQRPLKGSICISAQTRRDFASVAAVGVAPAGSARVHNHLHNWSGKRDYGAVHRAVVPNSGLATRRNLHVAHPAAPVRGDHDVAGFVVGIKFAGIYPVVHCTPRKQRTAAEALRALRRLKREAPKSPFMFVSERGGPFTTDSFNWVVKRAGQKAGLPFQVHAHMLRHAAGYKLAGDGHDTRSIQDYLGHKNIQDTVRYTELSPTRFKDFWRD